MMTHLDLQISQYLSKDSPSIKKLTVSLIDHSANSVDQKTGGKSKEEPIFTDMIRLQLEERSLDDLRQKASYFVRFQMILAGLSLLSAGLLMYHSGEQRVAKQICPAQMIVTTLAMNLQVFFVPNLDKLYIICLTDAVELSYTAPMLLICWILQFLILITAVQAQSCRQDLQADILTRWKWVCLIFLTALFGTILATKTISLQNNGWVQLCLSSTIWIPQIIFNFLNWRRKGLPLHYCVSMSASLTYIPLYQRLVKDNFFDFETDFSMAAITIVLMLPQFLIMWRQKTHGARWFAPERYRKNPDAYDYYRDVEDVYHPNVLDQVSGHEDFITCAICMNYIHEDVDESGGRIRQSGAVLQRIIEKFKAALSSNRNSSDSQNHINNATRVQEMAELRTSYTRNQEAEDQQPLEQSQQAETCEETEPNSSTQLLQQTDQSKDGTGSELNTQDHSIEAKTLLNDTQAIENEASGNQEVE